MAGDIRRRNGAIKQQSIGDGGTVRRRIARQAQNPTDDLTEQQRMRVARRPIANASLKHLDRCFP
jgi:hypothetical protein